MALALDVRRGRGVPSYAHEALLALMRECPSLPVELAARLAGQDVPPGAPRLLESDLSQLQPTEFRADLVLGIGEPARLGLIVEHQLRRDDAKRYTWPYYVYALRARLRTPVWLLVVAGDAGVARWASQPIAMEPMAMFRPLVLGPESTPRIVDDGEARRRPELSVLSAMVHGNAPDGIEVVFRALDILGDQPPRHATLYLELILGSLNDAARKVLEAVMQADDYRYRPKFFDRYLERGRQEGREEGRVDNARMVLARLVAIHLGNVPADVQERIDGADYERLMSWIEQMGRARSEAEVLAAFGA